MFRGTRVYKKGNTDYENVKKGRNFDPMAHLRLLWLKGIITLFGRHVERILIVAVFIVVEVVPVPIIIGNFIDI